MLSGFDRLHVPGLFPGRQPGDFRVAGLQSAATVSAPDWPARTESPYHAAHSKTIDADQLGHHPLLSEPICPAVGTAVHQLGVESFGESTQAGARENSAIGARPCSGTCAGPSPLITTSSSPASIIPIGNLVSYSQ